MFRRNVEWHSERRTLAGDAGDMHNTFRVIGAGFSYLGIRWRVQPARDSKLGSADRMSDVDVETGIVTNSVCAMNTIF